MKKIFEDYKKSYAAYLPFEMLLEESIVLNKNNGFQSTFKIRFYDLDFIPPEEYQIYISRLNNAYKRLPNGFSMHFEVIRRKNNKYPIADCELAPIPTKIIERIRENSIKNNVFYKTELYLTITYLISDELDKKVDDLSKKFKRIIPTKKIKEEVKEELIKDFNKEIIEFKNQIILFKNQLETASLESELLRGEELLGYLYSSINFEFRDKVKVPKNNEIMLDEYLSNSTIENGDEYTKLNGEYIKALTLKVFPDEVFPRIFDDLENLNFEFRYITRFIILSKEEALKILDNYRIYYSMKIKTGMQYLLEAITKNEMTNIDTQALNHMSESEYAINELKTGNLAYGYYTFTFLVKDKDLDKLNEKVQQIKRIVEFYDFTMIDDKYNTFDSILGTIPGNIVNNIRRLPMNTVLLSSLMPLSSIYSGNIKNKHLNQTCLFTTKTEKDLFYANMHVGDIGHSLIIGPTGAGKSTLLGFIAAEFLKYKHKLINEKGEEIEKPSQVIFFDKGSSSKVLTFCSGGKFYNLGNNELSFQPLRNIDSENGKRQAMEWINSILEQEKVELSAKVRNLVWEALSSLENTKPENRTLSNFRSFLQSQELKTALQFYCGTGVYAQYFDNNDDKISTNNFLVFEMGEVVREAKVIAPLLDYLFYKIETDLLDGTPTLIILDECWLFLKNPKMKEKIEEWLKVLRKKNASVIFATQSLEDITRSTISSSIIDACKTNIFLPNEKAKSKWLSIYKEFNLNDIEIETINNAIMKKEYFIKNPNGARLFSLDLSNTELSYVAASSTNDLNKITLLNNEIEAKILSDREKNRILNNEWLNYKFKIGDIPRHELEIYKDLL